jgi:hypothetical protein
MMCFSINLLTNTAANRLFVIIPAQTLAPLSNKALIILKVTDSSFLNQPSYNNRAYKHI